MTQWSEEVIRQVSFPPIKGQLISKRFFGVVDFLQKTKENKSIWGIIVVKLNLFVRFLEEIDDPKKPFRNQLTFINSQHLADSISAQMLLKLFNDSFWKCLTFTFFNNFHIYFNYKGPFANYVDKILNFFWPPTSLRWHFLWYERKQIVDIFGQPTNLVL